MWVVVTAYSYKDKILHMKFCSVCLDLSIQSSSSPVGGTFGASVCFNGMLKDLIVYIAKICVTC